MQYEQTQLQPWEICIQPWNSRSRRIGKEPDTDSKSKKPIWALSESDSRYSASFGIWPGPKATSTNGKRSNTSSLSDCDQHPPTPTTRSGCSFLIDCPQHPPTPATRSGCSFLSRLASPRCPMKRLSADSRFEQVLNRMMSATSRSSTRV